jgi:hypothetical protein
LLKRKLRGHLPPSATLADYEQTIRAILTAPDAIVYLYRHETTFYPTVVHLTGGRLWLAMLTPDGVMETAFVVENPDSYLQPSLFERIGLLEEVFHGA